MNASPPTVSRLTAALGVDAWDSSERAVVPPGRESTRRCIEILAEQRQPWFAAGLAPSGCEDRIAVVTAALGEVVDLWPEDFVCRVGAGCTFERLEQHLRPWGMRLAADAAVPERTTLGGALAAAERGVRGGAGGGLRDLLLGLTAVDGTGSVVKAGARVVKNVAGYDLARLHHGGGGAFGLVLDLVLKLQPRPQVESVRCWQGDLCASLAQLARVRRPKVALEPCVQIWINATASKALDLGSSGCLIAVVEGWADEVAAWEATVGGDACADGHRRARDLPWQSRWSGRYRWSVTASQAQRAWTQSGSRGESFACVLDLQGGGAQLAVTAPLDRSRVASFSAEGPLFPTPDALPQASTSTSGIVRRLKQAFDPHELLPPPPRPLSVGDQLD